METKAFFKDYAAALLTFSAEKISAFYQIPLTVYSDYGIRQVSKMSEVEEFWKAGVQPYKQQGITKAVPQILSEEQLSKTIIYCKVQWNNYDTLGKEAGHETNVYILSSTKQGLKISGLIIMAE